MDRTGNRSKARRSLIGQDVRVLRSDKEMDAAVNRGLAAVYLMGLTAGANLMREEGVPPEVMSRVLMHPELRRSTDWRR